MSRIGSRLRTSLAALLGAAALVVLPSCGGYVLKGHVIESGWTGISFVPADDPRLQQRGVPGVRVALHRDPDSLGRRLVATAASDGDGRVALDVGEFGAGWMVEQWLVQASRSGFETAEMQVTLPKSSSGLWLLVQLAPGDSVPPTGREDPMDLYEQFR
ncbi:MAG: hypothetical protein ACYTG1_06910 [Planctomycetota bacterium]|jgi:hypothetical protein